MLNPLNSEGNEVPENLILITPWNLSTTNEKINEIIQPLVGQRKRDWFEPQTYKCLALQIGNQYGFVIKAEQDFSVVWNGGEHTTDVIVDKSIKSEDNPSLIQDQKSHFGSGIVIIENKWILRTPPKVNLMTVQPPNWFKRGIAHMTGVIETDNLRRNFIFGLKITEPNLKIEFKKGEPIACFIVLPRFYIENFSIHQTQEMFGIEQAELELSLNMEVDASRQRGEWDRYLRGLDYQENPEPFQFHQTSLKKKCPQKE